MQIGTRSAWRSASMRTTAAPGLQAQARAAISRSAGSVALAISRPPASRPLRADDLGEPRARPDRVGDAPRLDISAAAALGAHQAALRQRREGAPHGVAVDAEPVGDLDLARQPAVRGG